MPENPSTKIMGYYEKDDGDIYCLRHGRESMLPITENDEDYFGYCTICGVIIDSRDSESDLEH